ncbi:hypothetical protein [Amycolatopsis orientalis]|uniref:hypothetical protein n=1 Tax=Amycolatopsis orientalis TaxID=31958 RepID=UPI0003A34DD0|nr:hypothetical protein [Amycolatopsis orientalis]
MNEDALAAVVQLVGEDVLAEDRAALEAAYANLADAIEQLRAVPGDEPSDFEVRWTP